MHVKNSSTFSDIKKLEVMIGDSDVSQAVTHVSIFQDVFFPVWTAELIIHDFNNLIMNIPIKPGTKLSVKIQSELSCELDGEKKFDFVVSHIKDRQFQNWMNQTYTLVCMTDKMFTNQGERVSKSFIKKKPNEVVKSILADKLSISEIESDSCDNKVSVIIPNISPIHAVNMMSKVATKDKAADFLFFQIDDEKYKFKSFEKLYKEEPVYKFKMRVNHLRDSQGNVEDDGALAFFDYQFIEHVDGLFTISSGLGASKLVEFDFISKSWSEKEYKFSEELSEDREKAPWDETLEKPNSNIMFMPKHPGMHDSETILDYTEEWESSRKNNLLKMEMNKLIIQMPGGVKIWEALGKTCEIEMPSQQDETTGEKYDKYFKGKYFIAAISHQISGTSYFMNLELVKKRNNEKM